MNHFCERKRYGNIIMMNYERMINTVAQESEVCVL